MKQLEKLLPSFIFKKISMAPGDLFRAPGLFKTMSFKSPAPGNKDEEVPFSVHVTEIFIIDFWSNFGGRAMHDLSL